MKHHKLVRDKIIEIIKSRKARALFHIADDQEYKTRLYEKLLEEAGEFLKDENEEELADIYEVLDAIIALKGFDRNRIEAIRANKLKDRGAFQKKIILEETEG